MLVVQAAEIVDVAQARTTVEAARADRATFRTQVTRDVNALELLVGEPLDAGTLAVDGGAAGDRLLAVARDIGAPVGLSSDLLLRRPDVLAAENNLRAANVNIGAARAARFPTLSLTTSIGQARTSAGSRSLDTASHAIQATNSSNDAPLASAASTRTRWKP